MLTLSEAIRLGAMLKPQAFGVTFDGVGTCAAGAAIDAVGRLDLDPAKRWGLADVAAVQGWDVEKIQRADCPACGVPYPERCGTIPHLNDWHRWSREQIADFVEAQEQGSARQPALLTSTDAVRGTTELEQPVLATRASL